MLDTAQVLKACIMSHPWFPDMIALTNAVAMDMRDASALAPASVAAHRNAPEPQGLFTPPSAPVHICSHSGSVGINQASGAGFHPGSMTPELFPTSAQPCKSSKQPFSSPTQPFASPMQPRASCMQPFTSPVQPFASASSGAPGSEPMGQHFKGRLGTSQGACRTAVQPPASPFMPPPILSGGESVERSPEAGPSMMQGSGSAALRSRAAALANAVFERAEQFKRAGQDQGTGIPQQAGSLATRPFGLPSSASQRLPCGPGFDDMGQPPKDGIIASPQAGSQSSHAFPSPSLAPQRPVRRSGSGTDTQLNLHSGTSAQHQVAQLSTLPRAGCPESVPISSRMPSFQRGPRLGRVSQPCRRCPAAASACWIRQPPKHT